MKKLMRKLVLSSFALGLAVITLSTTTFAWYTSNTDVSAEKISGASSSSGSALLTISNDIDEEMELKQWYTTVEVDQYEMNEDLVPVQYSQTGTDKYTFSDMNSAPVDGGYMEFKLLFKLSSSDVQQYLWLTDLTITTKAPLLPSKDVLSVTNDSDEHSADYIYTGYTGATYNVDIRRALLVAVEAKEFTDNAGLNAFATHHYLFNPDQLETLSDTLNGKDTFDAHKYYEIVMDESLPTAPTAGLEYGAVSLGNTTTFVKQYLATLPSANTPDTANNFVEVTFAIFLNGWDKACFDACQGQSFDVKLDFGSSYSKTEYTTTKPTA